MQDFFKDKQLRLTPLHDDNGVIDILDDWKGKLCILREWRKQITQMILMINYLLHQISNNCKEQRGKGKGGHHV
jgi:hypothetical protein